MEFQVTIAGSSYPDADSAREAANASGIVRGSITGGPTPAGTEYVFAIQTTAVQSVEEAEQVLAAAGVRARVQPLASSD